MMTMYTLQFIRNAKRLIIVSFILFALPAYARQEAIIASPQITFTLATNTRIYEHEDDECKFILSREFSKNNVAHSATSYKYIYIVTARYVTSDYTIWTNCDLPELGEWSVIGHKRGDVKNNISPSFTLLCKKYNSNSTITHQYTLWYGADKIHDHNNGDHEIYKWGFGHWGSRSSLEDLYQIRFAKKLLFMHKGKESDFTIFLSRDVQDDYRQRYEQRFDDLFFYITRHYKDDYYHDIKAYIIPRVYFVKLEKINIDSQEDPNELRFTIIVQHPLSDDEKSWTYHRLEILKKWGYQPFITINDLGPVPRSEWEPDWPDPADTPLWVEEPGK